MNTYRVIIKATQNDIYYKFKADCVVRECNHIVFYIGNQLVHIFSLYNLVECSVVDA